MTEPRRFGRYLLGERLGRGGMAAVYRGRDPDFDRDVAIKVLPVDLLHDPEFRGRFQREARAVARLEHPAIVPVYDIGEQAGQPYLVMRHMAGGTLSAKLAAGPIPLTETVAIIHRIASALDEAHRRGMVHRDLKPGNILFDSNGEAYLSDFGIVKWAKAATALTGGGLIGTPAYMSPEQSEGRSEIGPAADVYALGVVLFQMVAGRLPFEADTPVGLALLHMKEAVPRLASLAPTAPVGLQAVLDRAMAKDPKDRFPSAGEMGGAVAEAAELGPEAGGRPMAAAMASGSATPQTRPPQAALAATTPTLRGPPRRRWTWIPIGLIGILGLGLAVGALVLTVPALIRTASPTPSHSPPTSTPTPVSAAVQPSSPAVISPSPIVAPAMLAPADIARIGVLWSQPITLVNIRFPVQWAPDGNSLAVPNRSGTAIQLIDADSGALRRELVSPIGFRGVEGLAWSPDSDRLAAAVTVGEQRRLDIWRVADGEVVLRIATLPYPWCTPDWSSDSRYLACGPAVFSADSGLLLWAAAAQGGRAVFSPDGEFLAHGETGGEIRIYRSENGTEERVLAGHSISVLAIAWSPLDQLASGAWNGEILAWPEVRQVERAPGDPLRAEAGGVFDLAWSPDGELLLSAHQDHTARLWNTSLAPLGTFQHEAALARVSWSPDGDRFATTALDGLLRVWGLAGP